MAAALVSGLGGCIDEKKEVEKYRQVLGGPTTMPATTPAVLTLQDAMRMANARNEQLALSGEDYLQALIDRDRAVCTFLPTISLQPSYYHMETVALPSVAAEFFPLHAFDVPVNGQMNVFNGFRDVSGLKQAAANIDQRKALLKDLQSTLLVEVSQVYYQVLRSEKVADVLSNSVKVQEDRVHDLGNQFDAGVARKVDLQQALAQAAATRVSLVNAKSNVVRGRATLAFLVGATEVVCPLADRFEVPSVRPLESLQKEASTRRQDLVAAIAGIGAAKQGLQQAIGQYYPSVSVNVNEFLHRETFPSDSQWIYMFSANVPIFTGGRIHADVRAALSRLRQANNGDPPGQAHSRRLIRARSGRKAEDRGRKCPAAGSPRRPRRRAEGRADRTAAASRSGRPAVPAIGGRVTDVRGEGWVRERGRSSAPSNSHYGKETPHGVTTNPRKRGRIRLSCACKGILVRREMP